MQQSTRESSSEWQPLHIYLIYRVILAVVLLALLFFSKESDATSFNAELYFAICIGYLVVCLFTTFIIRQSRDGNINIQIFIIILIDILAITLLEYANGQSLSNLSILLIIAVAAGSILVVGKQATLFAAIATVVVLYQAIYLAITSDRLANNSLVQAGFLGAAFFVTSFFAQQLARNLRDSESFAQQKARQVAKLEQLNHQIIQRMRTGIIVVDEAENIRLINETGWKMLGMPEVENAQLKDISSQACDQLQYWKSQATQRREPFRATEQSPEVTLSFSSLDAQQEKDVLIFIDDNTRLTLQAQQLKLASLGRLTASIAHEIRNPLGAVSHAAQLLNESPELSGGDQRLANIIHEQSQRMNQIIENVLQLSRRKQAQPQRILIMEWLEEFLHSFRIQQTEPADIEISGLQAPLVINIDPSQMQQVLTNLLINGLRYSEAHSGKRSINLMIGQLSNGCAYLDIQDHGRGVSDADKDKIFEPFYTTDNAGTGLGLYIARELCEANQASLRLVPSDQGACFRISFSHPEKQQAL